MCNKIKVQYVCSDGEYFDTQTEAERHEKELVNNHKELRERYLNSYDGAALIKNHALNECGIWQIYGEDGDRNYSGSSNIPLLCTVQGALTDVIDHAIETNRFYTYGCGGTIKKVVVDYYV